MKTVPNSLKRTWQSWSIGALGVVLCCLAVTKNTAGQEPSAVAADVAAVRPFVNESTFLILKIDPTRIELPDLTGMLESMSPDVRKSYREISVVTAAGIAKLRVLVENQPIYASIGIPVSPTRIPAWMFVKKPARESAQFLQQALQREMHVRSTIRGDYLVASPAPSKGTSPELSAFPATPRAGIAAAFTSTEGYPVQVLLMPPPYVRRTFEELLPELPDQLGGGPSRVLTEGVQWAALGIDAGQLRGELVVHASSNAAAHELADRLPALLQAAYDSAPQIDKQIPRELAQTLIGWLKPQVEGEQISIRIDGLEKTGTSLKLLAAVFQTVNDKTRRHANRDRFKQILLAMHNYHDVYKSFPPANKYRGKDGKHHLSWRVYILPFVEQQDLYQQFHLDEPWDSPHNKKLLKNMPAVFQAQSPAISSKAAVKPGYTTFLAPVGKGTVFGGAKATRFRDIPDGSSNTIVLVEVKPERAVPWTAPDDYVFDPKNPLQGILIGTDGRWLCAFADGSVHQLRADMPIQTVLDLLQMNDGHPIDYSKIH